MNRLVFHFKIQIEILKRVDQVIWLYFAVFDRCLAVDIGRERFAGQAEGGVELALHVLDFRHIRQD